MLASLQLTTRLAATYHCFPKNVKHILTQYTVSLETELAVHSERVTRLRVNIAADKGLNRFRAGLLISLVLNLSDIKQCNDWKWTTLQAINWQAGGEIALNYSRANSMAVMTDTETGNKIVQSNLATAPITRGTFLIGLN